MTEYSITPSDDMQSAVDRLRPGDVLILEDGIYAEPIQPGSGVAGRADAPIKIKALNDGKVLIDGRSQTIPILLSYSNGNDYFVIEGINARNGLGYTIDASSTGNIFRRCIAWDAKEGPEGQQTWRANGYSGEYEDCVAFSGRYCLGANQMGNDAPGPVTVFRRCVAIYTGATISSPKASFIYWYNSDPVRYENCIGTWDCQDAPNSQGIFYCATADPYVHGTRQTELVSCIAYLKRSQKAPAAISGISAMGNRRITIDNCAVYMSLEHPAPDLKTFDLRAASQTQGGDTDLYVENCTGIGPDFAIHPDWQAKNVEFGSDLAEVYGNQSLWDNDGTRGARIDPEGFLPLPMNQRIIDAMVMMGRTPIDITADLEEIFGEVPRNGNPGNGGEPVTATLTATPTQVPKGAAPKIAWTGSTRPKDWIGMYDANNGDLERWVYVSGSEDAGLVVVPSGTWEPLMEEVGEYAFILHADDSEMVMAESDSITVVEGSNPGTDYPPGEGWVYVQAWVKKSDVL